MNTLWQDLRYGARMLIKQPGFTLIAVLTLALGIGATTAIFSVVNSIILRPLAYRDPDKLMWVYRMQPPVERSPVSAPAFRDFSQQQQVFETLAAHYAETMIMTETVPAERLMGRRVTANFFTLFGVEPERGRFFLPPDDKAGAARVAVISHGLWQRRFGGEDAVIGKTIKLNSEPHTIIGVAPPQFQFPRNHELWTPARLVESTNPRGANFLMMMGRLKEGVAREQAQAQVNQIAAALAAQYPANHDQLSIFVAPMLDEMVRNIRTTLWLLLGAVGFVLLIACANVANLLLARASVRQPEFAIRAALGAGRFALMRQLLVESLLLALLGGALGVLLASWGVEVLVKIAPVNLPRAQQIGIDRTVLGFTLLVSLLTGLIFGLAPAWQSAAVNLNQMLKDAARSASSSATRTWLRRSLVVAEIALSFVLLVGAGLLIGSARRMLAVNPGFDTSNLLTAVVFYPQKPESAYPKGEAGERQLVAERAMFLRELEQKVSALPGAQVVGAISDLPLSGDGAQNAGVRLPSQPIRPNDPVAEIRFASPDYFRALGVPLLKGNFFRWNDPPQTPEPILVNETLARSFFPNEDAVGKALVVGDGQPHQIVGVVGSVHHGDLISPPDPEIYFSTAQTSGNDGTTLVIRTQNDPASLAQALRQTVQSVNRDAAIFRVKTMDEVLTVSLEQGRFYTRLMTLFAVLALVLAAIGLYGVISYTVAQRNREIGLRLALGAQTGDVLRLILKQGMTLALAGVALGVIAALYVTSLMKTLLYGVSPTDPLTYLVIALLLLVVAVLACWLPVRRATKVDPMIALRCE